MTSCLALLLSLLGATVLQAQDGGRGGWYVETVAGSFVRFPEAFGEEYCDEETVGMGAAVGVALSRLVSLEGRLTGAGGQGGMTCAAYDFAPPLPGQRFPHDVFREGIRSNDFASLGVSAVLETPFVGEASVRIRAGVARLWRKKDLTALTGGLAFPLTLGRHELSLGMDAWFVRVPFRRDDILVAEDWSWLVERTRALTQRDRAVLLRLAYRWSSRRP